MKVLTMFVCVAAFSADRDIASWVEGQGGRAVLDAQGRIIAVDLSATWIADSDLNRLTPVKSLIKLNLGHTRISDLAFDAIRRIESLADLDLYYAEFFTDDGLAKLKNTAHLGSLNLRGTKVTSKAFETIAKLKSLKQLDIAYTQIDDSGVELLAELPLLEKLSIGGNRIGVPAVSALKLCPSLKVLDVSGVQRVDSGEWGLPVTAAMFAELGTLPRLVSLNLSGATLTDRGADRPGQKESIRTKLTGLSGLCNAGKLATLDLSRTPVDPEGIAQLKTCSNLHQLSIAMAPNLDDSVVPILASLPHLKRVDLENTPVTPAGLSYLRQQRPAIEIYGR